MSDDFDDDDFDDIEDASGVAIQESQEMIAGLDNLVLKLEDSTDADLVNEIYRRVHTIKGNMAFVGNGRYYSTLLQNFETVLSALREQKISMNADSINLMLGAFDLCDSFLSQPEQEVGPDLQKTIYDSATKLRKLAT